MVRVKNNVKKKKMKVRHQKKQKLRLQKITKYLLTLSELS